jgi:hypothetical protein
MFNWKLWGKGLIAAAIGGAIGGASGAIESGDLRSVGKHAGVGAALLGLGYLAKHPPVDPLPDELEAAAAAGIGLVAGKAAKKLPKPKR